MMAARGRRYTVKEIFLTVQGEGYHAGTTAVFIRLSGCNLWSGREQDRQGAICDFCDTDFVGTDGVNGGRYTASALAEKAREVGEGTVLCVVTGGEPLLQLDELMVEELQCRGFEVAVETNGTIQLPTGRLGIDWVCCSPKDPDHLNLTRADELKVVVPGKVDPIEYAEAIEADHYFVQPKDGDPDGVATAVRYVKSFPLWRISTQCHKVWGIE